ncbi:unnamed protein product [Larinioides sclopetarius]|uniref:Uncharacterized protein n=1 Tax=Larinioides sclopetarius TaxID=280406 RepID=A0AAV2BZ20_9ARAC
MGFNDVVDIKRQIGVRSLISRSMKENRKDTFLMKTEILIFLLYICFVYTMFMSFSKH